MNFEMVEIDIKVKLLVVAISRKQIWLFLEEKKSIKQYGGCVKREGDPVYQLAGSRGATVLPGRA